MKKVVKILKSLKLLGLVNYLLELFENPYIIIKVIYKIMGVVFVLLILLFTITPFLEEMDKKDVYLGFLNKVGKTSKIYVNGKETIAVAEVLKNLSQIEIAGFNDEGRDLKDRCREVKILSDEVSMRLCFISDLYEDRYWVFFEEYAVDGEDWEPLYLKVGVLDQIYIERYF